MKTLFYAFCAALCMANASICMEPEQLTMRMEPAKEQFTAGEAEIFTLGARYGKLEAVKNVLNSHPNIINVQDARGRTALHRAAMGYLFETGRETALDCFEIFCILLDRDANVMIADNRARRVNVLIYYQVARNKEQLPDIEERAQLLYDALHNKLTLQVNHTITPPCSEQAFVEFARRGEFNKLKALLKSNRALLNARSPRTNYTALHSAAKHIISGATECLYNFQFLLMEGADYLVKERHDLSVPAFIEKITKKHSHVVEIQSRAQLLIWQMNQEQIDVADKMTNISLS